MHAEVIRWRRHSRMCGSVRLVPIDELDLQRERCRVLLWCVNVTSVVICWLFCGYSFFFFFLFFVLKCLDCLFGSSLFYLVATCHQQGEDAHWKELCSLGQGSLCHCVGSDPASSQLSWMKTLSQNAARPVGIKVTLNKGLVITRRHLFNLAVLSCFLHGFY